MRVPLKGYLSFEFERNEIVEDIEQRLFLQIILQILMNALISNYIQSLISIVFDWSFLILVVILISERNEFHQNSSKVWIRYRCPISGTFCCEVLSGPKNGIDGDCNASRLLKVIFKQIFLQNLTKCMHAWALYGNIYKKILLFFLLFLKLLKSASSAVLFIFVHNICMYLDVFNVIIAQKNFGDDFDPLFVVNRLWKYCTCCKNDIRTGKNKIL